MEFYFVKISKITLVSVVCEAFEMAPIYSEPDTVIVFFRN